MQILASMSDQHKRCGHETPMTPRQKEGYDEAARGGKGVPPSNVGIPPDPGEERARDPDDEAAREARRKA